MQKFDNSCFTMMPSHRSPSGSSRCHAHDLSCCAKYPFPCLWVAPYLCDNSLVLTFKFHNALQVGTVAGALYSDRRVSMAATVGSLSLEVIKMKSDLMYSRCFRDRTGYMPISKPWSLFLVEDGNPYPV